MAVPRNGRQTLESRDVAILAARAASDKKAEDILAIEVAELLVVTDYFVICTGNTDVQVRAISDEVEEQLRERGKVKPIGREGGRESKWVLLDYGDLVVHVFQPEEREFYRLERLWAEAPRLPLPPSVTGPVAEVSSKDHDAAADPGLNE